eukprot:9170221-Lingulodinium_polyedra.AAC.1
MAPETVAETAVASAADPSSPSTHQSKSSRTVSFSTAAAKALGKSGGARIRRPSWRQCSGQ